MNRYTFTSCAYFFSFIGRRLVKDREGGQWPELKGAVNGRPAIENQCFSSF